MYSYSQGQAWSQLKGILCVSQFVAAYVRKWWPPSPPSSSPPPIYVVPLSAFGCFGTGPFQVYIMNWSMRSRLRSRGSKSLKYKRHVLYGWYCMEQAGGCSYHKFFASSVDWSVNYIFEFWSWEPPGIETSRFWEIGWWVSFGEARKLWGRSPELFGATYGK